MSLPCTAIALAQKLCVRALPTIASSPAPRFFIARATEPMLPEPRGRTMIIRRLLDIPKQLELLERLERLDRSATNFKSFQKFKTFQWLNEESRKQDYRRTI